MVNILKAIKVQRDNTFTFSLDFNGMFLKFVGGWCEWFPLKYPLNNILLKTNKLQIQIYSSEVLSWTIYSSKLRFVHIRSNLGKKENKILEVDFLKRFNRRWVWRMKQGRLVRLAVIFRCTIRAHQLLCHANAWWFFVSSSKAVSQTNRISTVTQWVEYCIWFDFTKLGSLKNFSLQ